MFIEDFHYQATEIHFSTSLHNFFNITIDVLDVAIVYHKEIYKKLWWNISGSHELSTRAKLEFLSIEGKIELNIHLNSENIFFILVFLF